VPSFKGFYERTVMGFKEQLGLPQVTSIKILRT